MIIKSQMILFILFNAKMSGTFPLTLSLKLSTCWYSLKTIAFKYKTLTSIVIYISKLRLPSSDSRLKQRCTCFDARFKEIFYYARRNRFLQLDRNGGRRNLIGELKKMNSLLMNWKYIIIKYVSIKINLFYDGLAFL